MATDTDKLLYEIRALPKEDKLRLLDAILRDIETPDPEIEKDWTDEVRRRWEAYKENRLETVSYEDLVKRYKNSESQIPHDRSTRSR